MTDNIKFVESGSITTPGGFKASGVTAGFKKSGAPDCAMLFSEYPANFAGAFTSCVFAAAPVQICRKKMQNTPTLRAAFINSGNANACTGQSGLDNAETTCSLVAEQLNISSSEVLVASTGRIGTQMPMQIVEKGVKLAATNLSSQGGNQASLAIMTTDTVPKSAAVQFEINGKTVSIGAMTKGAGMIDPEMRVLHATMICCITTDAKISNADLTAAFDVNIERSFNRITVDGDMSTNDTAIILANGASQIEIKSGTQEFELFQNALLMLMQNLAKRMVLDGEGASKFVEVKIKNAANSADAKKLAEAVANSLLCKTAWYGCDPNWGRVVAALGYAKVEFNPDLVDIDYNSIPVVAKGGDAGTSEEDLAGVVSQREFTININMNCGKAEYFVWTCDISHEYVKINADYHT